MNQDSHDAPRTADELPQSENLDQASGETPAAGSVYRFLVYGLSLPERTLRSTSGVVGGALRESASLLVPMAFRNSRSYKSFVGQMLDFMIQDVAGVAAPEGEEVPEVENYVARKSVSSFVELAGMATLHVSPLTVMAIVSDLAHGSNIYLKELSSELKREGVISENSTIDSTADLLAAVSSASGKTADALDTPPVSVEGLRETIAQTTAAVSEIDASRVIPMAEIERTWSAMSKMAEKENVSLFAMSSAVTLFTLDRLSAVTHGALSTIRVTGNMFDRHIFDHYRSGIAEIGERGVYTILAESSKPYIDAVWYNFSSERQTITEDLVSGKLIGRAWDGMRSWFGSGDKANTGDESGPADSSETEEPTEPATKNE